MTAHRVVLSLPPESCLKISSLTPRTSPSNFLCRRMQSYQDSLRQPLIGKQAPPPSSWVSDQSALTG
ncbi:hypothetical protein J6590_060379 [Homalodisca vitripennis]|nr:hypothetical protein J6590_060379 [Homalodisca vitripennis]